MMKLYFIYIITCVGYSSQQHFAPKDCTKGAQEVGPKCNALLYVWSWNDTKGDCIEVIYGGCRKTANNFPSKEDCLATAGPICKAAHFTAEDCSKGTEIEDKPHCLALFRKWHWNNFNQECEVAIYGGCNPTRNNFQSLYECEVVAKPVCSNKH